MKKFYVETSDNGATKDTVPDSLVHPQGDYKPSPYHSAIERIFSQTCSNFFSTLELTKAPRADKKTISVCDLKILRVEWEIRINGQTESHINEGKSGETSQGRTGAR